jgi:hypothetical protein
MMENDNDADTGTNMDRVKGEFLYSYFVRRVYVFRYPRGVVILRNRHVKEFLYQSPLSSRHILCWYVSTYGSVR